MKDLKSIVNEIKASKPEASVVIAVITPSEKGTALEASIEASSRDLAVMIDSIMAQYPEITKDLMILAMMRKFGGLERKTESDKSDETSEEFTEVN